MGLALAASFAPATAWAHPRIDAARAAYEEADLDAASAALDEAFDLGHLDREEYLDALVLRALVASAQRRNATRDDALRQIGAIAPDYALPDEAPPSLRARYAEIVAELGGERVSARLSVRREGERFTAQVRLTDPVRAVVRASVLCRAGEEVFASETRDVFGLVPTWRPVECAAQLLGRGDTLLAELSERVAGEGEPPPSGEDAGGDDALAIGFGVAGAVALLAAVAVVLAVVLGSESGEPGVLPSDQLILPIGFSGM